MTSKKNRIDILEDILIRLHNGASPESVQDDFNENFQGVSAIEISMMEQQLIFGDSNITFEDVLKLCNVHANMFKDSIDEAVAIDIDKPGHPVKIFKEENLALRAAMMRINNILNTMVDMEDVNIEEGFLKGLQRQYDLVAEFDKHYERKEKLFFPAMEKYGHTAPSKVMWGKDDEIRLLFKRAYQEMKQLPNTSFHKVKDTFTTFQKEFEGMIFKEESILLNILIESLTVEDWLQIAKESDAYGYTILPMTEKWKPNLLENLDQLDENDLKVDTLSLEKKKLPKIVSSFDSYQITFPQGELTLAWKDHDHFQQSDDINRKLPFQVGDGFLSINQIEQILYYVPIDITVYNPDYHMVYFNHSEEKALRPFGQYQINTSASLLYPKTIWQKLEAVFDNISHGNVKSEAFWFPSEEGYLHVSYYGMYKNQQFLGIVEFIHNLTPYIDIHEDKKQTLTPIEEFLDKSINQVSLYNPDKQIKKIPTQTIDFIDYIINISIERKEKINPNHVDPSTSIDFNHGNLSMNQIVSLLNLIPFEITFVDHNDRFQYFNNHVPYHDMIFKRTPLQIKRNIELCHPPHLWPTVEKLFADFKNQNRHFEKMWYRKADKFIHIYYQACYDTDNNYLGVIETVQDIQTYLNLMTQAKPLF